MLFRLISRLTDLRTFLPLPFRWNRCIDCGSSRSSRIAGYGVLMLKFHLLVLAILSFSLTVSAKKKEEPPDPAWAGITARGRMLAEYHSAARSATDAFLAAHPEQGSATIYIAKKTDGGWVVAFGRFNTPHDRFLVAYQATQGVTPDEFKIAQNIPPRRMRISSIWQPKRWRHA